MTAPDTHSPAHPKHAAGSSRKRRIDGVARFAVAVLVLALLAGGGYWGWHRYYGKPDVREQYQFATVQRGNLQDLVTATGTVQPRDYVDVGAQVSGQLKKLHVDVGTVVQAGDLLAEIDPTVFRANVDARRAGLKNLRASLTDKESSLALANLQANRQRSLMAADATTAETLQIAEATVRSAKAQIEALKAQIEQSESSLRADEATLNYAQIFAPMAGTVVSLTARQGQTLNTNQSAPTILRIADLSTMTVQTQVSEAEVSKLRQGMEVYFTTLGNQNRRWFGQLRKVEPTPTVTNNVVLYNALFDVPNTNNALMPSMSTQVFFIAASAQDALLVPAAAVTLQRQPARDRSGGSGARGERGGSAASGALSGGSSGVLPDLGGAAPEMPRGVSASSPAPRPGGATASVPMVPTAASAPSGRGGRDGMSKEERRAAFERMTPERQAFRDQHRAAGDSAGGVNAQRESLVPQNVGTSVPSRSKPPASVPTSGSASLRRGAHAPASAASTAGSDSTPRPAVSTSGFADTTAARAPRRGTVRVLTAAGTIEERQIEVGVTTRVQMQVLSGLEEGDEVVAGIKLPASAQQRANASGQGSGPGGPSGAAPGLGGAGRAR